MTITKTLMIYLSKYLFVKIYVIWNSPYVLVISVIRIHLQ